MGRPEEDAKASVMTEGWAATSKNELLGSEDAAPLAKVDQLQLVPRRGLKGGNSVRHP